MENYRAKLKTQNWFLALGALALTAVQVLAYMGIISPLESGEHWPDFWNGFIAGVAIGITILFIVGIITNLLALHNEARLKKLYVKEHDERTFAIYEKGVSAGAKIFLLCMLPATIITGYFSITVFKTCLACLLALSLFMVGGKLYYSKKI